MNLEFQILSCALMFNSEFLVVLPQPIYILPYLKNFTELQQKYLKILKNTRKNKKFLTFQITQKSLYHHKLKFIFEYNLPLLLVQIITINTFISIGILILLFLTLVKIIRKNSIHKAYCHFSWSFFSYWGLTVMFTFWTTEHDITIKLSLRILTHPQSRGYKMPNKILQRVQMLLEKGQCQGFPIPIWIDWSEIKQEKNLFNK